MKRVYTITLIVLLVTIAVNFAPGQVPYFQHILLLKKNDPVQVNKIFQDRTGYMWFGTNKGLFRFDGNHFQRFTQADSLPGDRITAIAEDSLGRIWTGHDDGMIAYLEGGLFHKFDTREGTPVNEISDIHFDKKGVAWFSTLNDGLYYFISNRLYRLDKDNGMPDLFIYDIEEDNNGNIWAGTDGGAVVCSLTGTQAAIKVLDYKHGLPDNIVKKVRVEKNGALWLGTEDAGIISYDPATNKYVSVIPNWHFGAVTDFLFDENQIWISSLQTGMMVYDRKTTNVKLFNAKSGPGFTSVKVLLKDAEGNIWAGSKTDIMLTRGDQIEFINPQDPVNNMNTVALAIDRKGVIWFSNGENLYKRSVDESGKVSFDQPLKGTPYQKYTVISLYADPAGYIWAGLYGEGVLRIHSETGTIRQIQKELRNGNILSISGKGNLVWLSTLGGGTRIRISGDKFDIRNYTSEDGLIYDYIYQIFVDSKDRTWFGTDGKGVDMLDDNGFHHFQTGLNSKVVYGFAEDANHAIWINVQDDGLYKMENERFVSFDSAGLRLRDNNISCLATNPSGNLFIMHDLGIDIYDVNRDKIYYLGEEAGISEMNPNLNAVSRDQNGAIYAGEESGIIKYSEVSSQNTAIPRMIIQGLTVLNQSVAVADNLEFRYNQNDLTIHYVGLWYQNPAGINYQYQLESYDREWINSQNNSVTYSRLAPGSYAFKVKASDTGDFKDAKETSFTFTIHPPFWQTGWFYGFIAVASIFLFYTLIKYRERTLRQDKQNLEIKVEERTLEIIKKNEEINAQAEEIKGINENLEHLVTERTRQLEKKNKALEEYAFINAHELRAPVASILGLINLMQIAKSNDEEKEYVKHLKTSADKLDSVVKEIGRAIEKGE